METPESLLETLQRLQRQQAEKVRAEDHAVQKPEDAIEKLKRIQEREAAKVKAEGRAAKVTPIKRRMIESSVEILGRPVPEDFLYQHTLFCQTVLPFRDPGPDVRVWEREQGKISLLLEAGRAKDPYGRYVEVGLPFGPAVRLILCHLNTEALRTGSPVIEVKDSITAFVHRLQGFVPNGREIRKFKDQLTRLSASTIRLAASCNGYTVQKNTHIVGEFTLWAGRFEEERFLLPQQIILSSEYFESLQEHAVPLDERAVSALAHSAIALDVYCWLAQRLHRVDPKCGQFIPWSALHQQFGQGYKEIRKFRRDFLNVLTMVKAQYPAARFGADKGGMMLGNSPPPVQRRAVLVGAPEPISAPPLPISNARQLTLPKPSVKA
jgi:hypothetical protein